MRSRITILGAGFQGCCAALALAADGHEVTLIDGATGPMGRASAKNTGKIHLGHVYAADPSFRTSLTMLESSIAFAPLLDRWTGGKLLDWTQLRTVPFTYLIMRDSIVPADVLLAHYESIERVFRELEQPVNYLGIAPRQLHQEVEIPPCCNDDLIQQAIATEECAVDVAKFSRLIADAVGSNERIRCRFGHRVDCVIRMGNGFRVSGHTLDSDPWRLDSELVVNALWGDRIAIDAQLGIKPDRPWVHRLKYRVFARTPDSLRGMPSLSMALGAYGDIIPLGDRIYLQWYPKTMLGWSTQLRPPEQWDAICSRPAAPNTLQEIGAGVRNGLVEIVPQLAGAELLSADAGMIFSWGDKDIDDIESEFHQRHRVGLQTYDGDLAGYMSIDTGKFTCAPLFAEHLRRHLRGESRQPMLCDSVGAGND